ncbi:MAG: hypothetical protein KGS61_12010 [Verrucomicrobia bacterium]|nr:hypothetical protein [Verrucomicrobiota bacterium]
MASVIEVKFAFSGLPQVAAGLGKIGTLIQDRMRLVQDSSRRIANAGTAP